jgi:soluble lytic murein transglycosylase
VRIESGEKALFNGDWDKALDEFSSALAGSQDDDTRTAALLGQGRAYYYSGDYARALDALQSIVDLYPESPHKSDAYFYIGEVNVALDLFGEAAQAYQLSLAYRDRVIDSYILERRADALMDASDYASAVVDYRAALQSPRTGEAIPLQMKLARAYVVSGDLLTAAVMYDDLYNRVTNDYTKAEIDLLRGRVYLDLGQTDQAYNSFLDAVENYPVAYDSYQCLVTLVNANYPVNELDRGMVDYYAGEYGLSIEAFDRYLGGAPSDPAMAYYYKGLAYNKLSNAYGAIELWNIVIQNYPDSLVWDDAWEQKGYIQWAVLGDPESAVQTLAGFVSASPVHPRASEFLYDAGRAAERAGNLGKAATLWERVAAEYPTSQWAYKALLLAGVARFRQQNYAEAQKIFERMTVVLAERDQKSAGYMWLGKTKMAQGDQAAALVAWNMAANEDPTGYYSERARDLINGKAPFEPPQDFDSSYDVNAERLEAETWLRATFNLPPDTNLTGIPADERLTRGTELWKLGLYAEASQEFEDARVYYLENPSDTYRLANYFCSIGLYRSCILSARQVLTLAGMDDAATMNAPRYFNRLRYGLYYSDLVYDEALKHSFHPLLLFSIIRQESFFESFIRSSANARGLMQIIPDTAQSLANELGWPPNFSLSDLNRPIVSLAFGSEYLDDQRVYLDGDIYAALAAYNGGPGNALAWKDLAGGDPDLFLEIIRFDETQRYIRLIYEMFSIYRRLYTHSS